MENKELKEKIIKLLNDDYVEDKIGESSPNISADAVESIADDIVNLLPIHDVSNPLYEFDRFVRKKYPNDYYLVSTLMDFFGERNDC